jgi:hypothetical protein
MRLRAMNGHRRVNLIAASGAVQAVVNILVTFEQERTAPAAAENARILHDPAAMTRHGHADYRLILIHPVAP